MDSELQKMSEQFVLVYSFICGTVDLTPKECADLAIELVKVRFGGDELLDQ